MKKFIVPLAAAALALPVAARADLPPDVEIGRAHV